MAAQVPARSTKPFGHGLRFFLCFCWHESQLKPPMHGQEGQPHTLGHGQGAQPHGEAESRTIARPSERSSSSFSASIGVE
jgi:hypothetical protein